MARHKWKELTNRHYECLKCGLVASQSRRWYGNLGACPETRVVKVFRPRERYRFKLPFTYNAPPLHRVDAKIGDVVTFTGKSLGYGNFSYPDDSGTERTWHTIIMRPREAFDHLEPV